MIYAEMIWAILFLSVAIISWWKFLGWGEKQFVKWGKRRMAAYKKKREESQEIE